MFFPVKLRKEGVCLSEHFKKKMTTPRVSLPVIQPRSEAMGVCTDTRCAYRQTSPAEAQEVKCGIDMVSDQFANFHLHISEKVIDFPKITQQGCARTWSQTQALRLQICVIHFSEGGGETEVYGFSPSIIL